MPPTRTVPPAKIMKTERTHEENQERAYIAASRRSDRSLEARVESARRASEIHKRRTGRSLRVTEQDVINEEMYEEEDDDLPLQYRRLTAHLQTGSADFNRRLAAYLTNQVAMRSAVGNMVGNSFGQPFPHMGGYPTGMMAPNMMPLQQSPQPMPPQSPSSYRQAPYPSPSSQGYRPAHARAYSTALPPRSGTPSDPTGSMDHRRMSTPAALAPTPAQIQTDGVQPDTDYMRQTQSAQVPSTFPMSQWHDSPFSASLPPESQQMLAGALDPNDPYSQMLLNGSEGLMSNPYYPWNDMQGGIKGMPVHPSAYPGMAATLAPAALEVKHESLTATPTTSAPPPHLDLGFDQLQRYGSHESLNSGQVSPGEAGIWDNFVQDDSWHQEEPTASQ